MNAIGTIVFFGWVPGIFLIFLALPPRRAVVVSSVIGWLFIPPATYAFLGLPEITKASATMGGILLAAAALDGGRLLRLRVRLYDLPMIAWCVVPFFSSISNGLGWYDGLSECLAQTVPWGLPYLVGRAYFADLDGLRELAVGIVVGGLIYAALCLFELRFSPVLLQKVYGIISWDGAFRFGAYRPRIFMATGLELGMWMTAASLVGCWLWACGSLKELRGMPFGWLLLALVAVTILCRSAGALLLLAVGLAALYASTRGAGRSWPVWALIAAAPLYMGVRAPGLWSASQAVDLARDYLGADRADSLEYRIFNEDVLAARALEQPILGWGGWGRMMIWNTKTNRPSVHDGLWIIALGHNGLLGLGALTAASLLPAALMLRRYPVRRWRDPDVAPAGVLAMLQVLGTIDNVSNAMINPIYTIAAGGLIGLAAARPARRVGGRGGEGDARASAADRHAALADRMAAAGRPGEAIAACRSALELRAALAADRAGDPLAQRALAASCEGLARASAALGLREESEAARRRALEIWAALAGRSPGDPGARRRWAEAQNDLAWALAREAGREPRDVALAVRLAARAVELEPAEAAFWNTLGAARYRDGAWEAAAAALEESARLGGGPNAFDLFLGAMAAARRGDPGRALEDFRRAAALADRDAPGHAGLARLRAEAQEVLGRRAPVS